MKYGLIIYCLKKKNLFYFTVRQQLSMFTSVPMKREKKTRH